MTAWRFVRMSFRFWRAGWRVERFTSMNPRGDRDEWLVTWRRRD